MIVREVAKDLDLTRTKKRFIGEGKEGGNRRELKWKGLQAEATRQIHIFGKKAPRIDDCGRKKDGRP